MKKLGSLFRVLCTVFPLLILLNAIFVTRNVYQLLREQTVNTTIAQDFWKFQSARITQTLLNKPSIQTTKRNHNDSTIGTLMTKSRNETILKLYGKSWDSVITTYATNFLIDGKNICNVSPPPFLLIFVLSLPMNTEERQAIRQTWGSVFNKNQDSFDISARMMFMLGKMGDEITQHKGLQEESNKYKDIVQVDLIESRLNLTRKMMSGLKWIKTYCTSVKYILKSDDDTFINPASVSKYLSKNPNINNITIHGWVYKAALVQREGKNKVTIEEFPQSLYPHMTCGTAYILPFDVISHMLGMAERVPYCPADDAFITGVLRSILDFKIQHSEDFTYTKEMKIDPSRFYSKISVTNIAPRCMHMLWNLTTQAKRINCERKDLYNEKVCPIFR